MHHFTVATLAMTKSGFGNIFLGDSDLLTAFHIGDAALGDGFRNGFFDMTTITFKKALPIDSTFVLPI